MAKRGQTSCLDRYLGYRKGSTFKKTSGRENGSLQVLLFKVKVKVVGLNNTPFTRTKTYLDPEVVPVYTGHSLFNKTKRITLLFIVQTLLHRNLDNIGISVILSRKRSR